MSEGKKYLKNARKLDEKRAVELNSSLFPDKPRVHDWIEDFPHENGCYHHQCDQCNTFFGGHKRRHVCKVCGDENQARWNTLSDEEKQRRYDEVSAFFDAQKL